jgi:hypothetical protein
LGASTLQIPMSFAAFMVVDALVFAHRPDNTVELTFSKGSER